ncbi:AcaB family transcriptional regulator [Vibrio mediterranei]|uniref:AcaB family transcriptional regulator n=1 Tax=Vibrio mediterranei TaxID=689 RepID=UPI0040676D6F
MEYEEINEPGIEDSLGTKYDAKLVANKTPKQNSIVIYMYTNDGISLLTRKKFKEKGDRKTVFVPGLDWFDEKIEHVFIAAQNDDPFADQLLKDLEDQIELLINAARVQKEEIQNQIRALFEANEAKLDLVKQAYKSEARVYVRRRLSVQVLWLIRQIDYMLYYIFQAEKHGILTGHDAKMFRHDAKRGLRNLLRFVNNWKSTAITRQDLAIRSNTKRVEKACRDNEQIKMTRNVLLLEERASCAPPVTAYRNGKLDANTYKKLAATFDEAFATRTHEDFDEDELA